MHLLKVFNCILSSHLFHPFPCYCIRNKMHHVLKPPEQVYLMKILDKSCFEKNIKVPVVNIGDIKVSSVLPLLKSFLFKVENFKPVNHIDKDHVCIYLNPEVIQKWADIPLNIRDALAEFSLSESHLKMEDFTLKYDNYNAEALLRAILPRDQEGLSSFTKVGHIVHVNLREHLIPFKNIIGEILFDKVNGCKSVVNKINIIDSTYRNFQMEVLRGNNNMHTMVKENNCKFEFDFSTVYWNSRLCTEHERIVNVLKPGYVLFDVFAGVGPFSIPAAKKKCIVYANDLNPESFKWLNHNKKLNKIMDEYFHSFNLDGREFILRVFKENMLKYIDHHVVITMNLPALAVKFLDTYIGLFRNIEIPQHFKSITVYIYCFAKGENPEQIARDLIHENLKVKDVDIDARISEIFKVRTVSSMKEMIRITLNMDRDILVGCTENKRKIDSINSEMESKKICSDICEDNGEEQEETQCIQSGRSQKSQNQSKGQSSQE